MRGRFGIRNKIIEVAEKLQDWIDDIEMTDMRPVVTVELCDRWQTLSIGRFRVWDSENFAEEDLTFETCQRVFRDELNRGVPFLGLEPKGYVHVISGPAGPVAVYDTDEKAQAAALAMHLADRAGRYRVEAFLVGEPA